MLNVVFGHVHEIFKELFEYARWIELFYVLFVSIVFFYVLFVCKCVLYYCHRVVTQLQLNISHHIIY